MTKDRGIIEIPDTDYQARIAKVKASQTPVGGAPVLAGTPRFDNLPPPPQEIAARERMRNAAIAATPPQQRQLLTAEERKQLEDSGRLQQGIGSGIRANQPSAAALTPEAPPESAEERRGILSKKTAEGLEALDKELQEQAKLANEDSIDELLEEFKRSPLSSKKRRLEIEARCPPMEIDDLLVYGELRQIVPILPNRLEVTYRSTNGEEDLFVKRIATYDEPPPGSESKLILLDEQKYTNRFLMDRYLTLTLTAGIHAVNGRALPPFTDNTGTPQSELFWLKFKALKRYPAALLHDISINYSWFTSRLEKLTLSPEAMKDLQGF